MYCVRVILFVCVRAFMLNHLFGGCMARTVDSQAGKIGDVQDPSQLDLALVAVADAQEALKAAKRRLKEVQAGRLRELWR